MIAGPAVPARRLLSATRNDARPDLLVHALAQAPRDVTLELPNGGGDVERALLLARAYGIADRVRATAQGPSRALVPHPAPDVPFAELVESLWRPDDEPAHLEIDMRSLAGERVAVVTNLPAPYRLPLFARLDERLAEAGAAFRVFFLSRQARGRSWMLSGGEPAFGHEFVPGFELPHRRRGLLVPIPLGRRLRAYRPTVVVTAGLSPAVSGRALVAARRAGALLGIWSGETRAMPTAASRVRAVARGRLVDAADFGIAYGYEAGEYLKRLRRVLPLVYGRNTSEATAAARRPVDGDVVRILAVADLATPRKGIDVLIDALALAPSLPCRLTIVGDGKLRAALAERARGDGRVRFVGALSAAETKNEYARADVFAFPTRSDVFGLALVEAMGAGLAVLTSSAPGAVADLAASGTNSLVVGSHRPADWAEALDHIVRDRAPRVRLGAAAAQTIARRWTIEHACESFLAGLRLGLLVSGRVSA